jgi:hypothetical protein
MDEPIRPRYRWLIYSTHTKSLLGTSDEAIAKERAACPSCLVIDVENERYIGQHEISYPIAPAAHWI